MSSAPAPTEDYSFPPSEAALDEPNGLIAVGGDLSPGRLLAAYRRGIFPWYEEPQPIMWWTPDPRSVLYPEALHISRSLRKTLRSNKFQLSVDRQFRCVVERCAAERSGQSGTWIGLEMLHAYSELHRQGIAHSIEVVNRENELVGGLYGLSLGRVFFGESMFALENDASKVALVGLVHILRSAEFALIDCQVESKHLNSLGAVNISRVDFERQLNQNVQVAVAPEVWTVPGYCGELL